MHVKPKKKHNRKEKKMPHCSYCDGYGQMLQQVKQTYQQIHLYFVLFCHHLLMSSGLIIHVFIFFSKSSLECCILSFECWKLPFWFRYEFKDCV